ncbi:MAG: hypothetical protein ABH950_01505 [Candidatus Altiarchaeota archaeon]
MRKINVLVTALLVFLLSNTVSGFILSESDCRAILPSGFSFSSANVTLRPDMFEDMDFSSEEMNASQREEYDEFVSKLGFDPRDIFYSMEEALACEYESPDGSDDFEVAVIKMKNSESAKQMLVFYKVLLKELMKAFSGMFSFGEDDFDEAEFEREWNEKIIENSATAFIVRGDEEDANQRSGLFVVGSYVVTVGTGSTNFNSIRSNWESRLRSKPGGTESIGSAISSGIASALTGSPGSPKATSVEKEQGTVSKVVNKVVSTVKSAAKKVVSAVKRILGGGGSDSGSCEEGEIRHGTGCCADQNANKICDKDE